MSAPDARGASMPGACRCRSGCFEVILGRRRGSDATALILYLCRRGSELAPSLVGVETFVVIVAGRLVWGIGIGWAMLRLRRWVGAASRSC